MDDDNDIGPYWAEAVKAYELECDHPIDLGPQSAELRSADDVLRVIESKGGDFSNFRETHGQLWAKLKRFVDPITTVGNLTANVFNDSNPTGVPVAAVLNSITHLVSAARQVSNAYDWIQTVFSELQNFSDRLRSHAKTTITSAMKGTIIAMLAFILRIIGQSERLIKRGRIREYLRTAFIGKDQRTLDLLDDLNKVIANEGRLTLALTHEKTEAARDLAAKSVQVGQETSGKIDNVHQGVDELTDLVKKNSVAQEAREIDHRLLESLRHTLKTNAAGHTDEWYSLFRNRLLKGSASWLQKEAFFDLWMQHRAPILWVFGGPGAGKTMLSTWLITLLNKQFEANSEMASDASVAYFFVKENVEDLRNPNIMFKTMAWQIQQTDPLFRRHAATVCEFDRHLARAEDTWANLFLNFYQGPAGQGRRIILVIDGLDEAEISTQRRLLRLMKVYVLRVRAGLPSSIQFAVFGRSTLRNELERVQLDREEKIIEVSSVKNHEDMENYITDRLKKLTIVRMMQKRKPNGPKEARKFARDVRQQVLDGASGVFLWAQLLLDQMEGKDDKQIHRVLASPPANLYDMIYSVFDRLSRDPEIDADVVNRLLSWVAFARRPLSFGELDVILRSDSGATNWFLWSHIRGKFASIMRLRFPKNWNPDAEEADKTKDQGNNAGETETSTGDATGGQDSQLAEEEEDDDFNLDDSSEDEDGHEDGATTSVADDSETVGEENEKKTQAEQKCEPPKVSDADQLYSWHQKHTIVDFSHQRFRDFLVLEGDPKKSQKPVLTIRIAVESVEIQIVLDCLKGLRAGLDNPMFMENYISYPAFHVFTHLAAIKENMLDKETKAHIMQELYWLMHEESGGRTLFAALGQRVNGECDAFWNLWLANNRTTSLLQRWFSKAAKMKGFTDEQAIWMKEAAGSVRKLLEPLARTAAKIWLVKKSYQDEAYLDKSEFQVWFIKGYQALDDRGNTSEELSSWICARDLRSFQLSAAEIEGLAEWAELDKTTHWYTGVGWILYEAGANVRARELLGKAIEMDSTAWVPMEATARTLGCDEDYTNAVSWMERTLATMGSPFTEMGTSSYLLANLSSWKTCLGDHSAARELADTAWMQNPSSLPAVNSYVRALIDADDWDRLMYVLGFIADTDDGYGVSYLVHFFAEYQFLHGIGFACRAKDQPEFILEALRQALIEVEKSGDKSQLISKLLTFGDFCHYFYDRDDETLRWWEEGLSRISEADPAVQRVYMNSKVIYTNRAAQLYFDAAVHNFHANMRPGDTLAKLKQLASATTFVPGGSEDVFALYTSGYPSLLYGRWLREYEKAEPDVWRKCFRARILEQMNGLDDDDPTNDTAACSKVAMSLFQADDEERAGAIISVLYKTLEEYMAQKRAEREAATAAEAESQANEAAKKLEELELAPVDTQTAHGDTESGAQDSSANDATQSPSTDGSGRHTPQSQSDEESTQQAFIGPHEAYAKIDTTEPHTEGSQLALQLATNAWSSSCGRCGFDAERRGNMWLCEICYNVSFCTFCLEKAKSNTLEVRKCNPAHCWYQAWPINEDKVQEMASAYGEGGRVTLRREWLETLRNEWLRD